MSDTRIALCLSGGGLRATLFHLGVIRALRECQIEGESALSRVRDVYSVSGGSILAAHMMLRWDWYTGDDQAFAEAGKEIYALAQRNIRDRVLRRAILSSVPLRIYNLVSASPICGRTHWLMGEYDYLFRKTRIDEAAGPGIGKPRFHLLTTNFKSGELCSFSGTEFEVERHSGEPISTPCGHLTLSRAVAASSAFPPMFPPMLLDDRLLARPRDDTFLLPLQLSDGGVYDNLGIEKFWRSFERRPDDVRTVIVSNAGSPFRSEATRTFGGMLSRNVRASDILMRRVGMGAERRIAESDEINDIVISLTDAVMDGPLDPAVQQTLRLVRTDLDHFNAELGDLLVEHGASAARQQFAAQGWDMPVQALQAPYDAAEKGRQGRIAAKAEQRSFAGLLFDFRDWLPLLMLWAVVGLLAWACWLGYDRYRAIELNKARVEAARVADHDYKKMLVANAITILNQTETSPDEKLIELQGLFVSARNQSRSEGPSLKTGQIESSRPTPDQTDDASPASPAVNLPVYVQFAGGLTGDQVVALNKDLRRSGWNMQGASGERIASARGLNEVRYAGANRQAAERLADAINDANITSRPVIAREVRIVGDRNLEVWISS